MLSYSLRILSPSHHLQNLGRYSTSVLPEGALAFIDGKWVKSAKKKTFEVRNPFSNEVLYKCANCDVSDAEKAVKAARKAFSTWSMTTARERASILRKWYNLLNENETRLAELLTLEQGKPLIEARGELQYSGGFLDWYAEEARRIYGQVVPAAKANRMHLHTREPIGVVVMITPWNFPTAMIARKTGAALAVGCTIVVKPAEDTPLSALAFAEMGRQAGLPDGVFNVVPSDRVQTAELSKYFCSTPKVDAISFTGSTAVGKILLSQSANSVKRVCLELGGNAPVIVFSSANIDTAVQGTIMCKFRGSGQVCVSANRIYVHSSVHDEFVKKMCDGLKNFVVGNGMEKNVNLGPLINERAVQKVENLIADAKSKGAKVVYGGKRTGQSTCFEPTLLTGITDKMEIAHTEIFGPVAAVRKFETEEEVMEKANDTRTGLAGYIFTTDYSQIARVTRNLQVGMVGVNEGLISCAEAAFGGVKESGLGREGASQGIDEFSQWKYICIAN